ncbi:MAG TPA: GNAT family protein, partial [Gaiellales bacterium]|nr:GNAT family protein [Gaiellales bacterium]
MIRGELVDLRPLTAADVEHSELVANDPDYNGPFGSFALSAAGDVRRRFELDGYLNHDHGRLVVADKSGATVGGVSYIAVFHGPPPSNRVYNIGIDIDPAQRRRGYGAEAQALLARYLFDTYTVERVEASTDVENIPSSAPSSTPASPARASCAARSGARAPGVTPASTASCAASRAARGRAWADVLSAVSAALAGAELGARHRLDRADPRVAGKVDPERWHAYAPVACEL